MSRHTVLAAGFVLACTSLAHAQTIGLYAEPAGINHEIIATPGGLTTVYVVMHPNAIVSGVKTAAFGVSVPDCAGLIYLDDSPVVGTKLGSANSGGVLLDFQQCLSLPAAVLTLSLFTVEGFGCCQLEVVGHSSDGLIQAAGCDDVVRTLFERRGWVAGASPHVMDRFPVNGATNVPIDVTMSWDEYYCAEPQGDVFEFHFDFGTTNPPPTVINSASAIKSYSPGNLQPNKTYYWRADGYATSMSVWSFTTGAIVPVDQSTWGEIKSLYR